jgi:adenosylcobinamide hydrolase
MDESLGDLIEGTDGRMVWACTRCRLIHEEKIADYLKKNPEASLQELKQLRPRS